MATPILTTKLHIPPLGRNLVPRPRLLERLDQGLHRKLTLVSAPAGFGKTTLLGEWLQSLEAGGRPPATVTWISLDEGDNDPARFSAYLAAGLSCTEVSIGQAGGEVFDWAGSFLQESHLVQWINQVAALPQAFVLVLDDYHWITSQVIHDAVAFLVDHLPENLHLVLATRADPPLPLPRLRARGHLAELRRSDLRFTAEEAAAFLNDVMGLGLSANDVAALEARTEGWIAGLQMASLAIQARWSQAQLASKGHSPESITRTEFVQAFTGSHRYILDYLVEEVLEQQPPALQEFLLKTSILERLSGPLCDAVTGNQGTREPGAPPDPLTRRFPDSQSILEHLEAANLFIVPLDDERRWYRYHRLFSDLLRKRLWQTLPELVPALHRRASEWYEQQGLMAEAIEHALAAHDFERAVPLIEGSVEATMMRSEVMTFLNWVERLPDERVRSRPTLCFYHAWALLMSGRPLEVVEQRLQDMASVQDAPDSTGRVAAFRAYLLLLQGDAHRAAELGRQALEHLPASDRFLRSLVTWISSLAGLSDGDLQGGSRALEEVARISQEIGNPLIAVAALCHQAKLQMRQGRLHQAQETLQRALRLATDAQGRRLPIASKALTGLGELEREWNDLEAAADDLVEGIELAKQWSELAALDAYFPLMRTRLAQGDVEAARETLEIAQQTAMRSQSTEVDDLVADLLQAHFFVSQGDVEGAKHWAERRGLLPVVSPVPHPGPDEGADFMAAHMRKYQQLLLARLFLVQGRAAEALALLEPLLALARRLGRTDLVIEIQILTALACRAEGRDVQAMDALAEALSLTEPGGYLRIFLDEGEPMRTLISDFRSWVGDPACQIGPQERNRLLLHAEKLLAAFPSQVAPSTPPIQNRKSRIQNLPEPLSERELEVLRLLAAGLSNPEIAGELVVAVSTVRSHCKSIYGKLGVHKRWDAVQQAQQLGLI